MALAQRNHSLFSDVSIFCEFWFFERASKKESDPVAFWLVHIPAVDNLSAISANQDNIEGLTSVMATPCIIYSAFILALSKNLSESRSLNTLVY